MVENRKNFMATGDSLNEKCENSNNNNTEEKTEKVLNKVKGPALAIDSEGKAIIPFVMHEEVSPGSQTVKNLIYLARRIAIHLGILMGAFHFSTFKGGISASGLYLP